MQRLKLTGCVGVIALLIVSTARGDTSAGSRSSETISIQISRLADVDPNVRAEAVKQLIILGEPARTALRLALATVTPQTQPEIDQILLHIPWVKPGDNDAVEQAFTGYADLDVYARCARIDSIASLRSAVAPALLRVILNDPSPAVRWIAGDALRRGLSDDQLTSQELMDIVDGKQVPSSMYLPPDENGPLLAAAGWAVHETNPRRAEDLLQRAVVLENDRPSAFLGQMDFVYLWLIDRADAQHDRTRMIRLLHQQADRTAWSDDHLPDAVGSLMAAQADYGSAGSFSRDLCTYRDYLNHPELVYSMGRLADRHGYALLGAVLNTCALLMSGESADNHLLAGIFLGQHGWDTAAERELHWSLRLSNEKSPYVYFQLSALADDRNDDLASAQYMELALQRTTDLNRISRYGESLRWSADQAWAEVHWHYLRAARQSNDVVSMKSHLEKLLAMDQDSQVLRLDPGMASDIVPALQDLGRVDEADRVFKDAFHDLQQRAAAAPDDAMPKNNLAWLCACSGRKLDEANKLASQAVAQAPEDAACLDTQAEVYLRQGDAAKAVEIETHALQVKPDDLYMQRQLDKFQAAVAKPRP